MEFKYTVNPDSNEPIMLINKHIGFDKEEGEGINGADFEKELLFLDSLGKKRIQVWINSFGGRVKDGYSIFNAILKAQTAVDTVCTGIAASIAGVIFQAGRNRIMNDFGILMYHNPYNPDGDMDEEDRKMVESMRNSICTMIAARAKKSLDDVFAMMDDTTFLEAEESKLKGFCDSIEVSGEVKAQLRNLDARAAWKKSDSIVNKLTSKINTLNIMNKEICNALGLNENSSESVIANAIKDVQNKYNASLTEVSNLTKERDALKEEKKTLSEKITEVENKAKEAEATAKKVEAKNLVAGFVKTGQIENKVEVINKWEEKAEADMEGVKAMLEALPLNKKSSMIIEKADKDAPVLNMAGVMAEIAKKNNK